MVTYKMFEEGGIIPYVLGFTIKLSNMLLQSPVHVFSGTTKISGWFIALFSIHQAENAGYLVAYRISPAADLGAAIAVD